VKAQVVGLATDEALAAAADHHDGVHVLVAFERGVAAGRDLEVAQLRRQVAVLEQHLARDVLIRRAAFLLVAAHVDIFPAEGAVVVANQLLGHG
jgi:hypothetical protein